MTVYSSKLFTGVDNVSKSIEENLKKVSEKVASLNEGYTGPVKSYFENLQKSFEGVVEVNVNAFEKSTGDKVVTRQNFKQQIKPAKNKKKLE